MGTQRTTWDGLPVSDERPHGATVVVYRWVASRLELLLLHRAHNGPAYEGDWAWTPPAGSRFPGEPVEACARRELREETGLTLDVRPTDCGTPDWHVYVAEALPGTAVSLAHDPEHDRFAWLPPDAAAARCRPEVVAEGLVRAVTLLSGDSPPESPRGTG
jgi:8-oxo-dGTP pyrophosphatase MutT (NUDIX family)